MFITHTLFTTPVTDLRHLPTTTWYDKNGKPWIQNIDSTWTLAIPDFDIILPEAFDKIFGWVQCDQALELKVA